MKVLWTESAAEDLARIVEYISLDNTEAARRVAKVVFGTIMSLSDMPYRGRKRSIDGSRELVFASWPYVAVYEIIDDKIYIEGIRHTSRNWSE
jgi:addiction module RelE/StbE family toxin